MYSNLYCYDILWCKQLIIIHHALHLNLMIILNVCFSFLSSLFLIQVRLSYSAG